jgi:hypothetical protein
MLERRIIATPRGHSSIPSVEDVDPPGGDWVGRDRHIETTRRVAAPHDEVMVAAT